MPFEPYLPEKAYHFLPQITKFMTCICVVCLDFEINEKCKLYC